MPPLIAFIVKNLALGAVFGVGATGWMILSRQPVVGSLLASGNDPILPVLMLIFSMASTFGLGFLATALLFLDEPD